MENLLLIIALGLRICANPFANAFQKKLIAADNHPLAINFCTYLALSVLCVPILLTTDWNNSPIDFWIYSTLGGLVGAVGNALIVGAMRAGELSVLGPINSYKAIIGIVAGIVLLGEMPSLAGIAGIGLIILGSYFVLDTTPERFSFALLRKQDIQFRIWAMILTAIEAVFVKKVVVASSQTKAFLSWCLFGAIFSAAIVLFRRIPLVASITSGTSRTFSMFLLLVACVGTTQLATTYAFAHMAVGYALALFQLSIILSVLLGYKLFREENLWTKLAGSLLMICGSTAIIFQ